MMVRLVDMHRAAELLRRHGAIVTLAMLVIVGFAALAAVGATEHWSDRAQAARRAVADATAEALAILDQQQRELDQLAAAAATSGDEPTQFLLDRIPLLAPGTRAAALYDPAGMLLLRSMGRLDEIALAALGNEAAQQARDRPDSAMLVTHVVHDALDGGPLIALARPWRSVDGGFAGVALVALDRSAFAGLELLRVDETPLFGGAGEPEIAGSRHAAIGEFPLLLRYRPTAPTAVQALHGAWPLVAIAVIGVTAMLSLLALLVGRVHAVERESTRLARVELELREKLTVATAAADRSDEVSRAKSEFFAQVTHELRTPLNAILGFSETIQNEMFGPVANPRYRDYGGLIHGAGAHLLSLINDLLDAARIEAGKMAISPSRISAPALARSALDLVALLAQKREIAVKTTGLATCPELNVDPRAMKQVLLNLLSNAIKYTPAGGRISLGFAFREDGGVTIEVADTGIGMSAEDLLVAFEPFGRASAVEARGQQGTGLGLSLARALVRLHGGELTLASRLDVGTTATATLPPGAVIAGPRLVLPANKADVAAA